MSNIINQIMDDLAAFLSKETEKSLIDFSEEISTDENQDYRRGYLAGKLFSMLQLKSEFIYLREIAFKEMKNMEKNSDKR